MALPPSFFEKMASYGFEVGRESLFELAFTHPSTLDPNCPERKDYERLEFLGDALMGLVAGELCYRYHPEMEEGNLSVIKSQLIRTESEADFAIALGLHEFIKVGPSLQRKVEEIPNVLEDVFESFLGALYLDQGFDKSREFLVGFLTPKVVGALPLVEKNPKSELQEALQAEHRESVVYRLLGEEGPSHKRIFTVSVHFEGEEIGRGKGRSKKEAEVMAAKEALSKMASGKDNEYLPPLGTMKELMVDYEEGLRIINGN